MPLNKITYVRLSCFYKSMFEDFIQKNQNNSFKTYEEMRNKFLQESYGISNYYENELSEIGYETHTIILELEEFFNNGGLGIKNLFNEIINKLKILKPNVLFIENVFLFSIDEIDQIKKEIPSLKIIYGFLASACSPETIKVLKAYDFIITSSRDFFELFLSNGLVVYYIPHAFHPIVLNRLPKNNFNKHGISFIGGLVAGNQFHKWRKDLLEYLVEQEFEISIYSTFFQGNENYKYILYPLKFIGKPLLKYNYFRDNFYILRRLDSWVPRENMHLSKKLIRKLKPSVYGNTMYTEIQNSLITFNTHVFQCNSASNMRLFEATGVGTCLLTDWKNNINEFFDDGNEIMTYKSKEECVSKIKWLMNNENKALQIGLNGQNRCLKSHTFKHRALELNKIISKHI